MNYYNLETKEVFNNLKANKNGLTSKQAYSRLKLHGLNEIKRTKRLTTLKIFINQFLNPLVLILIAAVVISLLISEFIDASVIGIIIILNALLGFSQEYKAEKAIELLKKLSAPQAKVIRNGIKTKIDSKNLVPGDIILLEPGDKISADARLISNNNLYINESTLTGESVPIAKNISTLSKTKLSVANQLNMVFSGTIVTQGNASAIITSTGMQTELGKVASLVEQTIETKTPLQKRLTKLGKFIGLIVIAIVALVFIIGILNGQNFHQMFLISLSLAVSAIPEGLPIVITIALALGVRAMIKRKSLIRKLQAIETLGSITVIATDKTGTLTKNEMTVSELFINNKTIQVTGHGYETKGNFLLNKKKISSKNFKLLLKIGANCNNASLPSYGDPTEIALLVSAAKAGISKKLKRINEVPFSSEKKYMLTTYSINNKKISYLKGAPEKILEMCNFIKINNTTKRLTKKEKSLILKQNEKMASNALRVLAMAYQINKKTIFVGLQGMIDPPRKEVKSAISLAKKAEIDIIMITGDNIKTAEAIAKQIGIKGYSLQGNEIEKITNKKLQTIVKKTKIFARVNPEHKVRILKALQKNNEIVAMTGDGINDAPALKGADVGIAMAIKGTDVAREASDIVLLDDNFNSIVQAIKEGRTIYDNIKKFLKFLLSVNFSEVFVILTALLLKFPLPLLPLQILWINLVTDSLPALALSKEPSEENIMNKNPRNPKEGILKEIYNYIIIGGILAFLGTLVLFLWELKTTGNLEKARTLAVTTAILFEMFFVFTCRSEKSLFEIGIFKNKYLVAAVSLTIFLQILVIYSPLNLVFELTPLNLVDWIKVILFALPGLLFFEIKKSLHILKSHNKFTNS